MSELPEAIETAINAAVDRAVAKHFRPSGDRYLRIREVATALNISVDTVRRMIADGRLRSIGERKLLRIPQSALDEFLSRHAS